jgi:hypothetical protein
MSEGDYYDTDALDYLEGDCPDCGGTGEVSCSCDGRGCSRCIDGQRTCEGCDGSGFRPVEPEEEY